jgi:outer membrane protein
MSNLTENPSRGSVVALGATILAVVLVLVSPVTGQAQEQPREVTLQEAINTALAENLELEAARLTLAEADEQVREAWGFVMPQVRLTSNYTRNLTVPAQFLPAVFLDPDADPDELVPVRFGADNSYFAELRVEQPLLEAGAFVGVGAAARFRALQAEVARGAAQRTVVQVGEAYFEALLAQERVRLAENALGRVRGSLAETRAMYEAGLVSSYDVLRLEVEETNLETRLRRAADESATAGRRLDVLIGGDGGTRIAVTGSLAAMDLTDPAANTPENRVLLAAAGQVDPERLELDELVALAAQRRPGLREAMASRAIRETELRYERVQRLPTVSLFGSWQVIAQDDGAPSFFGSSGQRADGQQIGLQVSVPIFTGTQRSGRIGQARAALSRADAEHRREMALAEAEIRSLVESVGTARQNAAAQSRAVEMATRGYEIVLAQYREGLSSQLEVTDAEGALRETEFNYAQAVYDYLRARVGLDQAVGIVAGLDEEPSR